MPEELESFAVRYGPWALVVGASDGVGLAYSRALAERGVNVVLLSRRQSVLDEVAAGIEARWGVETRTLAVDLTDPDASERILDGIADLEIGMVLYCAGADPLYEPFLASPVEASEALIQRNCVVPTRLCHRLATAMVGRGRGGIVVVSSGAALAGMQNMVAYGATKAFDLLFAEALWVELRDTGVDVLCVVLGATDTPALRRLLNKRGNLAPEDVDTPIPGAATPEEVVADVLENLSIGPTCFAGEMIRLGAQHLGSMPRNDAVRFLLDQVGGGVMDEKLS